MDTGSACDRARARDVATAGASRLLLPLLLLLALAAFALAGTGGTAGAGVEVDVEERSAADTPGPEQGSDAPASSSDPGYGLGSGSDPEPPPPAEQPQAEQGAPQGGGEKEAEVHEYSLRTGDGRVETADGVEELSLDLASRDEDGRVRERDGAEEDPGDDGAERAPVSTDGGSPFVGFGAGFEYVSEDEALARFVIPPFLMPIYVAAGKAYGVPWEILASINKIETDFCRVRHQVSYAGALGCMQFMPGTWKAYGVDASGDGVADPFNPVDSIYAAARYLKESGYHVDVRASIFAYNHADWYVDEVLAVAGHYGSLPPGLVVETTSLAYGRFPLDGAVRYADDFRRAQAMGRTPRGLRIRGAAGAKALATQDLTVKRVLLDRRLAGLFRRRGDRAAYTRTVRRASRRARRAAAVVQAALVRFAGLAQAVTGDDASAPRKLAMTLARASLAGSRSRYAGLPRGYGRTRAPGIAVLLEDSAGNRYRYSGLDRLAPAIRPGAKIGIGKAVGRLPARGRPVLTFSLRGAGGEPIDPRPLVDGYRLQEAADFYNAVMPLGGNPFVPGESFGGGVVSGTQRQLARRVLSHPGIRVYEGGRQDIRRGIVRREVLGTLLFLARNGLEPTVTSLRTGHGFYTASGNVSAHSFGAAVDVAAFNGQAVAGNQGAGSYTEQAIRMLCRQQDGARPSQLISLHSGICDASFAMADHFDHLHVGYPFQPSLGLGRSGAALGPVEFFGKGLGKAGKAKRAHERRLSKRLGRISNPKLPKGRGRGSIRVETEARDESRAAERLAEQRLPLRALPTASGARMLDIEVPAGASGDEAWGIGVVDGSARVGWGRSQVVLLAHRDGAWKVVGPPRDAQGRPVNPDVRALSVSSGGRGYAVGDEGHVVELRGTHPPRIVPRATRSKLKAVDSRASGDHLTGYAVGENGTAVRLEGRRAEREQVGSGRASLKGVVLTDRGAVAAGSDRASRRPAVYRRRDGSWSRIASGFDLPDEAEVRLTSLASARGELWVGGAVGERGALGTAAEVPFAARLGKRGWRTYCTGSPALAAVAELGDPTPGCHAPLAFDSSERGPITDVAVTSKGAVLATPGGLRLHDSDDFRPVPAAPGSVSDLGLSSSGTGWALGADGRMARIMPASQARDSALEAKRVPLAGGGKLATVAVAPGGDRALALLGGNAGHFDGKGWARATGAGATLRDAAWTASGAAWAIADSGELLRFDGQAWTAPGEGALGRKRRQAVASALDAGGFVVDGEDTAPGGLESIGLAPGGTGYAVGAEGAVGRFDGKRWRPEPTPVTVTLRDVAAGLDEGAVAVGDRGTLLERSGDGWAEAQDARGLVRGQDFTAVDALPDGSFVAAAAGTVIERTGDGWRAAALKPLGLPVRELFGSRGEDGELRAVALVGEPGAAVILAGTREGWQPVQTPAGLSLLDVDLERESGRLWLLGNREGKPVAGTVPDPHAATGEGGPEPLEGIATMLGVEIEEGDDETDR